MKPEAVYLYDPDLTREIKARLKAETFLKTYACHSSPDAKSAREGARGGRERSANGKEQGDWSEEQMAKGSHREEARGNLPGFRRRRLICQRSIQLQKGVLSENDSLRGC
jgi:hypothetical protein